MPGSLSRHSRIEYAAIAGYVVLVAVITVMTGVKANMARHASPADTATMLGRVLYASSDFIAAACLLLIGTLMLYHRRKRNATVGAAGEPTVRPGGPPFLL